jgi:hypothetical protein
MSDEKDSKSDYSRRSFLRDAGVVATGFMIVPRHVLGGKGFTAPSDMLNIASIGVGGKGEDDINHFYSSGKANIAYLCDVDDRRAANSVKKFPKAKFYKDWREMLDKEHKNFDAVSVSTPDHTHAVAAYSAMSLGKAVYVQKPLTHDVYEARMLTKAAKRYKVVTQMGNQGASGDGVRQLQEWYDSGIIGDVHTVYCRFGRKVFQDLPLPILSRRNWIITCGWEQRLKKIILIICFPLTGADGGTMALVLSAIWDVTLCNLLLVYSISAISTRCRQVLAPYTPVSSRRVIFPIAALPQVM